MQNRAVCWTSKHGFLVISYKLLEKNEKLRIMTWSIQDFCQHVAFEEYMMSNIRFHWAIENMCSCFTNLIFDMRTRLESFKFCSDEQNRCGCLMILISNHSLVWQFTWYQYKRMMKINEVRISGDINIKSQMVRPLMVSTWYRYTVVSFLSRSNRNQWSKNDRN